MPGIECFPLSRHCFRTTAISRSYKLTEKKFGHPTARILWTSSAYLAFLHVFGPSVLCSRPARVKQPRILCEGAARISSTLITTHFFPRLMSIRLEKLFTTLSVFIIVSMFFLHLQVRTYFSQRDFFLEHHRI